jgi:hypothetical protein
MQVKGIASCFTVAMEVILPHSKAGPVELVLVVIMEVVLQHITLRSSIKQHFITRVMKLQLVAVMVYCITYSIHINS